MTIWKQVRGLRALVEDVVEHGSRAVERAHLAGAGRTFAILERVPLVAEPARLVHVAYDASTEATYVSVRLVNRAVGVVADLVIDALEARRPPTDVGGGDLPRADALAASGGD